MFFLTAKKKEYIILFKYIRCIYFEFRKNTFFYDYYICCLLLFSFVQKMMNMGNIHILQDIIAITTCLLVFSLILCNYYQYTKINEWKRRHGHPKPCNTVNEVVIEQGIESVESAPSVSMTNCANFKRFENDTAVYKTTYINETQPVAIESDKVLGFKTISQLDGRHISHLYG